MKTLLATLTVLVLLALDWAALHDIMKANEPDYTMEYAMLAASGAVFAALILAAWRRKHKRAQTKLTAG